MAPVLLFVIASGCSTPTGTVQENTIDPTEVDRDNALNKLISQYAWVPAGEYACLRADHQRHMRVWVDASNTVVMGERPLHVPAAELTQLMSNLTCAERGAVVVHLGLDGSNSFLAAVELVCLTEDIAGGYEHAPSSQYYTFDSSGNWTLMNQTLEIWWMEGPGMRYERQLAVMDHPGSAFRRIKPSDTRSITFPWVELEALIIQNSLGNGFLAIEPIAEPLFRNNGLNPPVERYFQQRVCWYPVGRTLAPVSNPTAPFRNMAADLGSPCPSECGANIRIRTSGIEPRPSCGPHRDATSTPAS
jgi:hypothetical protein